MREVTVADGATLDLAGRTLTVAKAKVGETKLKPGTYKATDEVLSDYVSDSSGTNAGVLEVTGGGLAVIVR